MKTNHTSSKNLINPTSQQPAQDTMKKFASSKPRAHQIQRITESQETENFDPVTATGKHFDKETLQKFIEYPRNPELEKIATEIMSKVEQHVKPTLRCEECGNENIMSDVSDYIPLRDFIILKIKESQRFL